MRIFLGYDPREKVGFYACLESLLEHCKEDVSITPLCGTQADGTNTFTYSRFRIPEKCNWSGPALFIDGSDMLLRVNIEELWELFDPRFAVQVVKHDYKTKHPRKYIGTKMESDNNDYPRKNWSSVILWNAGHKAHFDHRDMLRGFDGQFLHRFQWLKDEQIGELPVEYNWLADEYGENEKAKLLHWTAGQPGFYHYHNTPHSEEWRKSVREVLRGMD